MARQQGKRSTMRDHEQLHGGAGTCSQCGKLRFLDKAAAKKAIRRIKGRGGRLHPYRCGDFWHIGHVPSSLVAGHVSRDQLAPRRVAS